MKRKAALALPDQLLVRYFRAGEIDRITKVTKRKDCVEVHLTGVTKTHQNAPKRTDIWRDLGGGLGYVPDPVGD
jgi:hypothetical protein